MILYYSYQQAERGIGTASGKQSEHQHGNVGRCFDIRSPERRGRP